MVGLLARAFLPYLARNKENPETADWSWEKIWPQALGFVLIIFVLPLVVDDLQSIWTMDYQAAWLVGWAAGDIGRRTYKALAEEE